MEIVWTKPQVGNAFTMENSAKTSKYLIGKQGNNFPRKLVKWVSDAQLHTISKQSMKRELP